MWKQKGMWTYRPVISAAGREEGWRDCAAVANIVGIIPTMGNGSKYDLIGRTRCFAGAGKWHSDVAMDNTPHQALARSDSACTTIGSLFCALLRAA